jgi:hypothetical protein
LDRGSNGFLEIAAGKVQRAEDGGKEQSNQSKARYHIKIPIYVLLIKYKDNLQQIADFKMPKKIKESRKAKSPAKGKAIKKGKCSYISGRILIASRPPEHANANV